MKEHKNSISGVMLSLGSGTCGKIKLQLMDGKAKI